MLDIYITESNTEAYKQIKNLCFNYLMKKNYDSEIYTYSYESVTISAALFMLEFNNETEALSRKIRNTNSRNYIVVLLENYNELKRAVTPGISPSGFLIKPYKQTDVEAVLEEIYSDYIRCNSDSQKLGMFVFKQKAKEYSIPFEKIILFESRNKKVIVRTEIQEFEFYDTLESVMTNVPDCFMKIHKSFIVNLLRIISADYGAMTVEFDDGSVAYMSRTYKSELKERLNKRSES